MAISIKEALSDMMNMFNSSVLELESKLLKNSDPGSVRLEIDAFKTSMSGCFQTVNNLVQSLEFKQEEMEAYSRRNCLLFHGIQEQPEEEVTDVMVNFINNMAIPNFKMSAALIDDIHRLGPRKSNSTKPRPIIIKFMSYVQRKKIWEEKRRLKGTSSLITESLSKCRMDLYNKTKMIIGKFKTWTFNGRVFALIDGRRKIINSVDDLPDHFSDAGNKRVQPTRSVKGDKTGNR